MKKYDFIIAGGGLAGLSLACHLVQGPLRDRSILIIDKSAKDKNDRTWGFWTNQPTLFDDIVYRSWDQLHIASDGFDKIIDLQDYRYQMIRGLDLYQFARRELTLFPNVEFRQGVVQRVDDGVDQAKVIVDGRAVYGHWVFNSLPDPSLFKPVSSCYQSLNLHFRGLEIETAVNAFNPQTATLMDFRTPQQEDTRFFYLLPFSERQALIEYTLFTSTRYNQAEYEQALNAYLQNVLGISDYRVTAVESGSIPITDQPLSRQTGQRILNIGARGGQVKPTTGYAFLRVQQDSKAIIRSLLHHGHPYDIPGDGRFYHLLDSLMLQVMCQHGNQIKPIFTTMFKRNPIRRILRFLDETTQPWEILALMASLPPQLFLRALFQGKWPSQPAWRSARA